MWCNGHNIQDMVDDNIWDMISKDGRSALSLPDSSRRWSTRWGGVWAPRRSLRSFLWGKMEFHLWKFPWRRAHNTHPLFRTFRPRLCVSTPAGCCWNAPMGWEPRQRALHWNGWRLPYGCLFRKSAGMGTSTNMISLTHSPLESLTIRNTLSEA